MPSTTGEPYVDIYLLPVPEASLDTYRSQAISFGAVTREHGALSYREFVADAPGDNMRAEDGVVMTAAVVEFTDRAHRDAVMGAVMEDPRVEALMAAGSPADMSRMSYGGFETLVSA